VRKLVRRGVVAALPHVDVDTHFNPRYDPWDQRMCFIPDGDLFRSLRRGDAEVVTDTIDTFTETGIRLDSGRELEADLVVTATGLKVQLFGDARLVVDGDEVKLPHTMTYRALMLSGVPNFAFTIGYTNASWTLKADLVAEYVCRLLEHLDEHDLRQVVAPRDESLAESPLFDFTPGYVMRALDQLPVQGDREPWKLRQHYRYDAKVLRRAPIDDGVLEFR
jgi:cation diffusion facilitator CzcD-associated flavoprotein CzcO